MVRYFVLLLCHIRTRVTRQIKQANTHLLLPARVAPTSGHGAGLAQIVGVVVIGTHIVNGERPLGWRLELDAKPSVGHDELLVQTDQRRIVVHLGCQRISGAVDVLLVSVERSGRLGATQLEPDELPDGRKWEWACAY